MSKAFRDVVKFNQEVIGLKPADYLNDEKWTWFHKAITEELGEFSVANAKYITLLNMKSDGQNIHEDRFLEIKADMVDAIIDLIYFAYGRLYEIGITEEEFDNMWNAVQEANMQKKRGNKGRGSDEDAIKPAGWVGPENAFIEFRKKNLEANKSLSKVCNVEMSEYDKLNKNFMDMTKAELNKWLKGLDNEERSCATGSFSTASEGVKYDSDKPDLSLVFGGFSKALKDVGYVGTFGAHKYSPNGWKTVPNLQKRYMSALLRHTLEILDNNIFDNETGRHHLAHVAWNALALLEDLFNSEINYHNYNRAALIKSKFTLQAYFEKQKEQNNG